MLAQNEPTSVTTHMEKLKLSEMEKYFEREGWRAEGYNIFSALFCQPEKELLTDPKLFETLRKSFDVLGAKGIEQIDLMQDAVGATSETDLLIEYARLFVGPFKTVVPPYSSIFLGSRTVMSDDTMWVLDFYRKAGMEFNRDV
ncbi:MAG: hypothetical protein CUN57_00700, partial [Phototrophicales bacterium]